MTIATMSQTDVVISGIKSMISTGRLATGDRLPIEGDLATELRVSRGSLREGVRALSSMGILETRQGAGTFVTALDPAHLLSAMAFWVELQDGERAENVHTVRRALETEAAATAARNISPDQVREAEQILDEASRGINASPTDHEAAMRADIRFHSLIADACGNHVLAALIETVSPRTVRARMWRSLHDKAGLTETHRDHVAILRALQFHDAERARTRMASHLYAVEDFAVDIPKGALDSAAGGLPSV